MPPPAAQASSGASSNESNSQAGALEAQRGHDRLQVVDEGRDVGEHEAAATGGKGYVDDDEDEFSDEPLVVVGFNKGGYARRVSAGGIARIEEKAGTSCAVM